MIVIYTQDETIIKDNADAAKRDLLSVYGEKLGEEAYKAVKNGRIGAAYRKYGGPLVCVVSPADIERVRTMETKIGMLDNHTNNIGDQ